MTLILSSFLYVIAEDVTCNVAFSYLVVTKILPSLNWMGIFFSSCTFRTVGDMKLAQTECKTTLERDTVDANISKRSWKREDNCMHETLPMKLLLVFVRSFVCLCCLGIGETPFGKERHKQSKQPRKRTRKSLQVSISKTPVTPKSDQEEPGKIKDIVFFFFFCLLAGCFLFFHLLH